MAYFNKINQAKREGKIVYGDGIVDGIVLLAVSELDNVELYKSGSKNSVHNKAIKVVFDKSNRVIVDVVVNINYNQSVSEMAFKIQEAIRHNVEAMTEYHVESVNVHVYGVNFDEKSAPIVAETEENNTTTQG
jgi:uncharacterized alkaline shock family protein YloU